MITINNYFCVIHYKLLDFIEADMTKSLVPIHRSSMPSYSTGWIYLDVFCLEDIGVVLESCNTMGFLSMLDS